jgi:hypothetical protein
MKLTEKQAILLLAIAKDTLDVTNHPFGGLTHEARVKLVEAILNQQSDLIRDVE